MTSIEVVSSYDACRSLRTEWNEILFRQCATIEELDLTSSFEWVMQLWQTHLDSKDQEVLVLRDDQRISGILPLYRLNRQVRKVPCRILSPMTELFSGRSGFLLREPRIEYAEALLDHAGKRLGRWDVFQISFVEGSAYERMFLEWARKNGRHAQILSTEVSPYTPLLENWQRHFASLPSKLRTKLRSGEKRLRERGELAYREYRSADEVTEFNLAVREIERDSWKAAAGTSIASNPKHEVFHQSMALRAAEQGWLSGHLLLLNREPVAYVDGLLHNGVFLGLKASHRQAFRDMSPGHVLTAFLFERLYEHRVRIYDFMGKCEEYKMRWAANTYTRNTYMVFNHTLRARAARLLDRYARSRNKPAPSLQEKAASHSSGGPAKSAAPQPASAGKSTDSRSRIVQ